MPPTARRIPTSNGDDYAWLRERDSKPVLDYLKAENAFTDRTLAPTAALQKTLVDEFTRHTKLDDQSVPYRRDGWLYFAVSDRDSDYPRYYRKRSDDDATPQLLLDPNALAKTLPYVDVGAYEPSDDGKLLAYTIDSTGFRQYALAIRDIETGANAPGWPSGGIDRVTGVCWSDASTLFYSTEDATTKRSNQIWRLALGGKPELVYEEKDEAFNVSVDRTVDKSFVLLTSASYGTGDCRVVPAKQPRTPPREIGTRTEGVERYVASHHGHEFFVRTNDTGKNFRLVTLPDDASDLSRATELVPARDKVFLDDVNCYADHVVLTERADGLPRLSLLDVERKRVEPIPMPEAVYAVGIGKNVEADAQTIQVTYESLVTPPTTFALDLNSLELRTLKRQEVPGGYDPAKYDERMLYATARDGTRVPISIVARKDRPTTPGPLLVDVYGAYGLPEWVWFEPERLSLLDRGVAFAIVHVRGGGELGKRWHDDGRLMNKRHTFEDAIDAVAYLQSIGLAAPKTTAINGASAGGLTVGAVLNMRPDLFKCALLGVPFVDVMNTMLDPSLPLTTGEYREWGDPRQPAARDYMRSYSPYDNLAKKDYPATLVTSSYFDSQVMYWEPTKYVARRRALNPSATAPLLLSLTMTGGHDGPSGRTGFFDETARRYAFVLWQLGATQSSK